jgi:hypothetical protein
VLARQSESKEGSRFVATPSCARQAISLNFHGFSRGIPLSGGVGSSNGNGGQTLEICRVHGIQTEIFYRLSSVKRWANGEGERTVRRLFEALCLD